jgi:AcrR family transcriptional regulator
LRRRHRGLIGQPTRIFEMEASAQERVLTGEKAQRIVDAMRASVAERGIAGSTFEHVAREAGVSRGLLHYYFGTKERLLVEVIRRDTELRLARFDAGLAPTRSVDDVVAAMVASLQETLEQEPEYFLLLFELFTALRRAPDIEREIAEMSTRTRDRVAEILRAKEKEGILKLRLDADAVADYLLATGDGFAFQILTNPGHDATPALEVAMAAARYLLSDE